MLEWGVSLTDMVSGPAKNAESSLSNLASGFESLADPAVAAGVALGLATAAVGALSAALYEGAKIAISASDAYGDMVTQLGDLAGGGDALGASIVSSLDELSARLPKTRTQLADWAQELLAAGLPADELNDSLTAMASAEALMGKNGKQAADQVGNLMRKVLEAEQTTGKLKLADKQLAELAKTGVNVSDVADAMGESTEQLRNQLKAGTADAAKFGDALQSALVKKGAGALAGNLTDLPVQIDKAKESFTQLFEGVDTSGFLGSLTQISGMMDQSTTSGRALKWVVTTVFNTLFSLGQKVLPYVHLFLLKMINAGLRIYIIFKPVIKHFKDLWSQIDAGKGSIDLMDIFVDTLVGGAMMAAFFADNLITVVGWVISLSNAVTDAAESIGKWLGDTYKSIRSFFSSDEGSTLGGNLVDGLVAGITGNSSKVIAQMTALAKAALGAAKKTLGVASDAKEGIKIGGHLASGLATGIDRGVPEVEASASAMGQAAVDATPASPRSSGGNGGGLTINVMPGAVVIQGAGDVLKLTEEALALLLERLALSQGLGGTSTP